MERKGRRARSVACALGAAALYALSTPLSKLLLSRVGPTTLAGLLYVGAGIAAVSASCALLSVGGGQPLVLVGVAFRPSRLPVLGRREQLHEQAV